MSSKKDMRRNEFIIPFVDLAKDKKEADVSGTMATTLPMAAMFTRNKMIGWAAVVFSIQNWLGETPEQAKKAGTPGYLSVGMSLMAVMVTYLPLFLPPTSRRGTNTEAPAAVPQM